MHLKVWTYLCLSVSLCILPFSKTTHLVIVLLKYRFFVPAHLFPTNPFPEACASKPGSKWFLLQEVRKRYMSLILMQVKVIFISPSFSENKLDTML